MTALALAEAGQGGVPPDLVLPPGFDRIGETVRFEQDFRKPSGEPEWSRAETTEATQPAPAMTRVRERGRRPARGRTAADQGSPLQSSRDGSALPGAVALAVASPPPDPEPDDVDEPLPTLAFLARTGRHTMPAIPLRRDERRSAALTVYPDVSRPQTRGDCQDGPRPCPFVSCKYHLYLDVDETGALKFNAPGEPDEMPETCALDVADRGGGTLEMVARLFSISRERIRQIEAEAFKRARRKNRDQAEELVYLSPGLGGR